MKISKDYLKQKRDPHLHSPAHVLADELSSKLGDERHFAFYLKTALTHDHNVLRQIAGQILEGKSKNPGALFAYLLKKHNRENQNSSGYSLWLSIAQPEYDKFSGIIKSLASVNNSPKFDPHITLLSKIDSLTEEELTNLTETLVSQINSFSIQFGSVHTEELFFKTLYVEVLKSKELDTARRKARKTFGVKKPEKYLPHLSLAYGNFPENTKAQMIQMITNLPQEAKATEIKLVKTIGPTEDWNIIKQFPLQ
ncbi:MAG TPA: 2'-5' RNA ligase family protein [Candidatus Binatia bacterium]|nr:2'-5' RNA ligase family protein [Candidatus Binatia bacterium]